MAIQEKDILNMLNANYQKAVELMPAELAKEFQEKIIRPAELKGYASSIYVALQFKDNTSMLRIQNWMADHFNKNNFGKKLANKGLNPGQIYEQLLKGFFDY